MLKNLKKVAAIVLSFAMAVQFGLADSYYVNAVEEPVEPQQQEETTTTTPQEQEEVPTAEEETPQQQKEDAPAAEETNEQAAPETKSVELSYVAEDGTVLHETASRDFNLDYSLKTDSSVMLNFDGYTLKDVIINNSQTVPADQANLSVTSDLVSVKFVYVSVNTKEDKQTSENNEQTKTEEASEDDAEADPETKEELPEYPAFDQSETAGNVVVHATAAEGVLPRDSKLVVKRITRKAILNAVEDTVSEKNKEMDSAVALDITIQNKDGVEIQPNGSVNISFENAAVSGDEINVYHVSDDASAVTEVATNTQSFDTNHFSIYVITGENEVPLTTFNFVANGESVSTQIVKTGDTLITPTAPDVAGKVFVGWYDGEAKFEDFNTALTITETKTREITARYEDALYVYFYNPDGTQIMRTEKVGDHDPHGYTDVSYDVDSTHKLVGWAAEVNGTENIADKISVPKGSTSVNVYAIIKEGYWVSFDSDGGSIIDSQFVLHGDKLVLDKSTTPIKPGYKFDGWYNGSTKVENGATVTNPMTLKAHWNAAEVNYTINYWQQKVTDDKNATDAQKTYEYVSAETKKATTGTKISATNSKTYKGFKYNENNSSKDVEIAGDGTTIINVYYDRVLCTVNFYVDKGGYYWSDWQITKTVTGLYGANLPEGAWDTSTNAWYQYKDDWNRVSGLCVILTSFDFETAGYANNTGNKSSDGIVTTCNFYGKEGKGRYKINYYNEQIDGSFKLVQTVSLSQSGLVIHEKYAGYELYKYSTDENAGTDASYWTRQNDAREGKEVDGTPVNVASKLKTYSLSYYNYNKVTKTEKNIKYTASLKSYANYTPAKPSELPSYYVFGGWYKDKACTTKFDFNTEKMPNANVQIYAKWTAQKINLTYNLNTPDGTSKVVNNDVDAGTIANTVLPSATTTSDYSFAGWYYADGNGNITKDAFNANEAITKDTSVIGKWLYNGKLTVVYDPGTEGSKAKVPTDSNVYAGGAKVTVAKNATTTSKKKFLGWKLNGNLYHPGDAFEVNKDIANKDNQIILTATWGNAETSTTLTYDPGNGIGKVKTVDVMNNDAVEIEAHDSDVLGFTAPVEAGKEYYFAGWADSSTGNATYADGQTINIDANGENVLYAVWVEKKVITVTANSVKATYDGKEHEAAGFETTKFTVDGNEYTVSGLSAKVTGTDADSYTSKVTGTAVVKDKAGKDVTAQFTVNTANGTLTISPRSVTLTSQGKSREYNGKALELPEVTVEGDGFVNGEVTDIKATGSITRVGKVTNTITYTPSDKFKEKNYTITKHEGELEVTNRKQKYEITVTANSVKATYDGKEHEAAGFETTKFTVDGNEYTVSGLSAKVTGTDADSYTSKVTGTAVVKDKAGKDVTAQFTVNTANGTLTISPRSVTLTSQGKSREYNGKALELPEVTVEGDGFVNGEVTDIKATGSITRVGKVTNTITYTPSDKFKEKNYTITKHEGELEVTNRKQKYEITVTANSVKATYDGKEHEAAGFETTKFTVDGNEYTVSGLSAKVTGTDADSYTSKVTGTAVVKDKAGKDVTAQFTVNTANGTLTISPRSVTLTSQGKSREYNGKALELPEVTVEGDGFVNGEVTDIKATGSITRVGKVTNTITYTPSDKFKEKNYTITKHEGELEVTNRKQKYEITVTANSVKATYDGKEHEAAGFETTKFTVDGNEYTVSGLSAKVTGTDADSYTSKVTGTAVVKDKAGKDVTAQFTVNTANGTLTISPRSVTLTSQGKSREYNGKALELPEVTVEGDGFVNGEVTDIKATGSITRVGKVTNTITYTPSDKFKEKNYTITKHEGELEVTNRKQKYEITVTANSVKATYDGKEHEAAGFETTKFTVDGNEYTVSGLSAKVTGTDADSYTSKVTGTAVVKDKAGKDVTAQFTVNTANGTLTISPRSVTLTSQGKSREYNGKALELPEVTVEGDGFVNGEVTDIKATGSITRVGKVTNTITYTPSDKFKEKNYTITKHEGELEVTNRKQKYEITVTANSVKATYDGKEHEAAGFETTKFTVDGNEYTVSGLSAKVTGTDADSYTSKVTGTAVVKDKAGKDVTAQFTVNTANGTLTISPRSVTLTSQGKSREYNGKALELPEVTVEGDGFVNGEVTDIKATGSITRVGKVTNTITYTPSDKFKEKNYTITKHEGELEVTNRKQKYEITVTANSVKATYDGKEHEAAGFETTKFTVDGNEYTVSGLSAKVTGTDADSYTSKVTGTAVVKDKAGKDVTAQFTVNTANGTLTISPRSVTLTSQGKSREYNGKALELPEVTVEGDGFVNGEVTDIKATGSITRVGKVTNTITYTPSDKFKEKNYTITKHEGELEVTNRKQKYEITVTANSVKATYDGKEHEAAGFETTKFTVDGNEYTVSGLSAKVTGTDADSYTSKVTGTAVVKDKAGKDVTAQFTVNTANGTLTISPRSVTLTSQGKSREYNGKALELPEVTVEGDGFVNGEVTDIKATGSITRVGKVTNTITYTPSDKFKEKNYTITKHEGELEVTNRKQKYEITVTANSVKATYDGKEHEAAGFETTKFTVDGNEYTVSGLSAKVTGTDADSYTSKVTGTAVVKDKAGKDVTAQFTVNTANGTLTISPRSVTLTSQGKSREYNGKALELPEVTVEGDGFVNGEVTDIKATGSITRVGKVTNTITYTPSDKFKEKNYTITKHEGELEVTNRKQKYEITVTANSVKATYDGKEHEAAGFETTKFTVDGNEYTVSGLSAKVTGTDADSYTSKVTGTAVVKDKAGKDVTAQFTVNTANGTLTISPRSVTLTSQGKSREYNGKALELPEVTVEGDGFVNGEVTDIKATGSITRVGKVTNTITYTPSDKFKEKNYTITKHEGELEVTNRKQKYEITVTANSVKATYDGKEHEAAGFETTKFTVDGNEYTVSGLSAKVTGTDADSYTSKVTGTAVVKDKAGKDVTAQFTVNTANGTLTISPRSVTLTSQGKSREYNGKALELPEVTVEGDGFVNGEVTDIKATGSITRVGKVTNTITYTPSDKFKEKNYTITKHEGELEVTNRKQKYEITVTANSVKATYDGKEHEAAGFETTKFTVDGNEYTVSGLSAKVTGTDADSYTSKVTGTAVVKDKAGKDVTAQFTVNTANGTLTISPRSVTLTSQGKSREYNGKALELPEVTVEGDGFVNGEVTDIKATGSITRVGKVTNTITYTPSDKFKEKNYTITKHEGELSITEKSIIPDGPNTPEEKKTGIKVTAPKDTTYSGNEQKREPVIEDTKTGKKLDKDDYSLSYSTDVTNAGTVTITVTGKGNYTGKFEVNYKILPRKVTLKSEAASKPYDGTALTKPDVKVSGDGFVKGEVSDIKATGSVTTVSEGEVTNTITFTKETDYKDGNYTIFKEEGKLSITPQSIDPGTDPEKPNPDYTGAKVNSPSDEVYDGNEHKWIPTVTDKADKKLKAGTDYTVEYSTKNFKDVGTIDVTITGKGNYTGTVTRTYKITPKSVTVTAEDKTKVFGETDPKLTAKVAGTLGNDTVEYTLSRETGEAAGNYEITVKGDKLQGNYKVTYVAGTLTITSQSIDPGTDPEKPNPDYTGAKVNSPKDSVYDGKEHKWSPTVTDKTKTLELGKDYTVEYSTSDFTNVGAIEVTITGIGNYSGTVKRSYKVTPKEYTVTTESATKTYSGTALTACGKVEGIISGETVEFTTTGSQTEVGTSKNTYELVWKSAKATNYTLVKESIGELTVKAKSIVPDDKDTPESDKTGITVSEPSDSKYDGKEHKEVLTVTDTKTGKELVAGTDYSVTYSSDLVNAGTVKVTVAGLGNYSGSFAKTYKITKRSVTLTSATVSKVYDGSALTNTSIAVSGDGFVEGEGASYEVTGSQTVVGNSANSFEYKLNEKTLASNYNITKVVGTLTITAAPAPITPATPSTPSSTTSTTPRTPSAPQVTTPAETVEKETTPKAEPKKEEKVEEEYTPKASPQYYWALINLICAILTVLFGLLLLISKRHKDEDDDEDDDETKQQTNNDDEEKEQEKKRGLFTRVLAVLIAIVSVVFFLVTEDLSLPWTWTDQWTIWMVVIGLVQIVVFFVGRKWKNVDDDEDEEEAQQA